MENFENENFKTLKIKCKHEKEKISENKFEL